MEDETMDWEAEAKHIAWAFDLEGDYRFEELQLESGTVHNFCLQNGDLSVFMPKLDGANFVCQYSQRSRSYWIQVPTQNNRAFFTSIAINSHFGPTSILDVPQHAHLLARGLARLGYLTPEVEAELEVCLTAHEKLEWALEYEERFKFDNPL